MARIGELGNWGWEDCSNVSVKRMVERGTIEIVIAEIQWEYLRRERITDDWVLFF